MVKKAESKTYANCHFTYITFYMQILLEMGKPSQSALAAQGKLAFWKDTIDSLYLIEVMRRATLRYLCMQMFMFYYCKISYFCKGGNL